MDSTPKQINKSLKHLHIDYLFDLDNPSDLYIVYKRFLFSKAKYGDEYKAKALTCLQKILNLSYYKRNTLFKKNPILTIQNLIYDISTSRGIHPNDLDLFTQNENLAIGKHNRNKPLGSINNDITASKYDNRLSNRVDSCISTDMHNKNKPQCYKYTSKKIRKYTPYNKHVTSDTYCITSQLESNELDTGPDFYTPLYNKTKEYIDQRIKPEELANYPKTSIIDHLSPYPQYQNRCKEDHTTYWE